MKRFQIKETLIMGYINVPDDVDESNIYAYMDIHNCWPQEDEVDSHDVIRCPDADIPPGIKHIISEPGDGTRYDYVMDDWGNDQFFFQAHRNTFSYPGIIISEKGKVWAEEEICRLAVERKCNPWTVKECLRAIKEVQGG